MDLELLRYPIGKFEAPETVSDTQLTEALTILEIFPNQLRDLVANLDDATLDTPYRPEGWTIRQLVHHISDSHHNSYLRFKWALTEDNPVIKVYNEKAWAALDDSVKAPIAWSLNHLEVVHQKLVYLLKMLNEDQWEKTFQHPESGDTTNLKKNAMRYAWHSMHHYSHIKNALDRM